MLKNKKRKYEIKNKKTKNKKKRKKKNEKKKQKTKKEHQKKRKIKLLLYRSCRHIELPFFDSKLVCYLSLITHWGI